MGKRRNFRRLRKGHASPRHTRRARDSLVLCLIDPSDLQSCPRGSWSNELEEEKKKTNGSSLRTGTDTRHRRSTKEGGDPLGVRSLWLRRRGEISIRCSGKLSLSLRQLERQFTQGLTQGLRISAIMMPLALESTPRHFEHCKKLIIE